MTDLREHLDNLLKSPGWQWLEHDVLDRWQTELVNYVGQAAAHENDAIASQRIRQVVAAHKAVQQVFARPKEKLRELTTVPPPETWSRRGPL
jgi:hypothetical protein